MPLPRASANRITPSSPIRFPLKQRLRSPADGELAPAASDDASACAPLRPIRFQERSSVRSDAQTLSTAASASAPMSPSKLSCSKTPLTRSLCRTNAATSTRPPEGPMPRPPSTQSPSTCAAPCQNRTPRQPAASDALLLLSRIRMHADIDANKFQAIKTIHHRGGLLRTHLHRAGDLLCCDAPSHRAACRRRLQLLHRRLSKPPATQAKKSQNKMR
jgi:hypothetical protein